MCLVLDILQEYMYNIRAFVGISTDKEEFMAKKIHAIQAYSPRTTLQKPMEINSLAEYIEGRCGINKGSIKQVLCEFSNAIDYHCRTGVPVRLEDVGIFRPGIDKDGNARINFKADAKMARIFRKKGYKGKMKNDDMIGKSMDDYIARWNQEHQDDKIKKSK